MECEGVYFNHHILFLFDHIYLLNIEDNNENNFFFLIMVEQKCFCLYMFRVVELLIKESLAFPALHL